jgi:hypothetical protein
MLFSACHNGSNLLPTIGDVVRRTNSAIIQGGNCWFAVGNSNVANSQQAAIQINQSRQVIGEYTCTTTTTNQPTTTTSTLTPTNTTTTTSSSTSTTSTTLNNLTSTTSTTIIPTTTSTSLAPTTSTTTQAPIEICYYETNLGTVLFDEEWTNLCSELTTNIETGFYDGSFLLPQIGDTIYDKNNIAVSHGFFGQVRYMALTTSCNSASEAIIIGVDSTGVITDVFSCGDFTTSTTTVEPTTSTTTSDPYR